MRRLPETVSHCYTEAMAKDAKRTYIIIDVTNYPEFKLSLEKEAAADGRDLANYCRHLLTTHPSREKGEPHAKRKSK